MAPRPDLVRCSSTIAGSEQAAEPAEPLRLVLLGGFRVEGADNGEPVGGWQRRTAKSLTKLLGACPEHALHREQILDLLWPGVDPESALNSFGKALHAARRAFEPGLMPRQSSAYLRLTDSMLALDARYVTIDTDRFEQLAESALCSREIHAYEAALSVYGGDLLPEDRFADWCADRRTYLADLRARLQLGLADALEERGAYSESANHLRAVLRQDPTREEVHRRLIRLYAEMGTPDQSVRQFQLCREALRRELDLTPRQETVALYQDVLASRVQVRNSLREHDRSSAGSHRPPIGQPTPRGPFVGRKLFLVQLSEQLFRGSEGKAGMALISGEAGVGKTRLLEEFAIRAARQGAAVLWGGSGAHASQFAYGPFAVALERFAASRSQIERNALAEGHPALVPFLPSLGTQPQLPPPADDPREDHPELVLAVVRLLTDLARRQPVVLVLGDLHDVDAFSLDLLLYIAHLAVGRRWLTLAAVREEDVEPRTGLHKLIDAATRERLCVRLDLHSLSRQESAELVRKTLSPTAVSDQVVERIYNSSRGNPFFTEELVRELQQSGELELASGNRRRAASALAHAPERVRALMTARMARMGDAERRILGLAAAASATEIPLEKLRAGAGALQPPIPEEALLDALDHALQTRLLEQRATGYAFRYPLLRSALYQQLPIHRRNEFRGALSQSGRGGL